MAKDKEGVLVGRGSFKRIADVTREVETARGLNGELRGPNRRHAFQMVEGVLIDAIESADDPNSPTSGTFQIKTSLQSAEGWASAQSPSVITVLNRFPNAFTPGQVAIAAEFYPNKWFLLGGGVSETCPCTCVSVGDITVHGVSTTMKWNIIFKSDQSFPQSLGNIVLPAGTYIVEYDFGVSKWILDVGDYLKAYLHVGTDVTAFSTLDGDLQMEYPSSVDEDPTVTLCVEGTVSSPP